jgi:hypothetical protein
MKKLDTKRNSPDKGASSQTRRGNGQIPPVPPSDKHRKSSKPNAHLKLQPETESVTL